MVGEKYGEIKKFRICIAVTDVEDASQTRKAPASQSLLDNASIISANSLPYPGMEKRVKCEKCSLCDCGRRLEKSVKSTKDSRK